MKSFAIPESATLAIHFGMYIDEHGTTQIGTHVAALPPTADLETLENMALITLQNIQQQRQSLANAEAAAQMSKMDEQDGQQEDDPDAIVQEYDQEVDGVTFHVRHTHHPKAVDGVEQDTEHAESE